MEARIARLESDVTHLLSGVTDIKADVRGLRDRMDAGHAKLSERIDTVATQLNAKIDDGLARLQDAITATRAWSLALHLSIGGAILGAMARGFGWI